MAKQGGSGGGNNSGGNKSNGNNSGAKRETKRFSEQSGGRNAQTTKAVTRPPKKGV